MSSESFAFGKPGIEPRWTHGNKDGVGTAYAASCHVWFTVWNGIITELYYPTIDRSQIRDLQFLITDGETFFHEEKRHLGSKTERLDPALGYRVTNDDPEKRYRITKEIITDPHLPCVLQRARVTAADAETLGRLRLYLLCAPHLELGGWGNNAEVVDVAGRRIFIAHKKRAQKDGRGDEEGGVTWMALGATAAFGRMSCGYAGRSDGWTDLDDNRQMDWEFARAEDGNIALTGELLFDDAPENGAENEREFTVGVAFGDQKHAAVTTLFQALGVPFEEQRAKFVKQWERPCRRRLDLEEATGDGGNLYRTSYNLLLAHEDKRYPGALIASLSIPWGEARSDDETDGYHRVWVRDMTHSALALLAAGNSETAWRAFVYLAANQQEDGNFAQSFWINGRAYWRGKQLDQVAYPVLLARRLHRENQMRDFDPYPTVLRAASYIVRHGPVTQQERWEEASGLSPSTLAAVVAALVCAASFARERGDEATALFLEDYADWIESRLESWTATNAGTLLPEVKRHYVRIHPARAGEPLPDELPDDARLSIANRAPGERNEFAAKEIVDAGFLEYVRYGIRDAKDQLMIDSLRVIDHVLRVHTPGGPVFRRYNHDGYGQRDDGKAFSGWGRGRAWPLLSGERGHYEVAAGGDPLTYLRAIESCASPTGLLPEQVWDADDLPAAHMRLGKPTGSAMPLAWAHGEYIKLLRSMRDGQIFDRIPEVAARYIENRIERTPLVMWEADYPTRSVKRGETLRLIAERPFRARWSSDEWQQHTDVYSTPTALGVHFADFGISAEQSAPLRWTFFWTDANEWAGRDHEVQVN